ncbi:MAG: PKD domain-containing protein, partial [Candidatus Aminicenantes bacterium]|nr:PKD domain-containing protein [Candidatus Aminicenantes bacterium]
ITFSPGDPRMGETVAFTAQNFFSDSLIRWDFGDGTVENDASPPGIGHAFVNSGTYPVRAYDGGAGAATSQTVVQVMPPRLLMHSPQQPRIGDTVTFQAVNFLSPILQWDFGDGSGMVQAGFQTSHDYNRRGIFTVTAMDTRGGAPFPVTDTVSVVPNRGALAPFSISFVRLRFDDGRSYKVVNKNYDPLIGFGEIKYEGTGLFVAQWLVDGSPFKLISQPLIQAESILLDTGQIPGLPTLIPGVHELSLNIIQPVTDFQVPTIRYFVTVDQGQGEMMNLQVSTAQNLNDESIPVYSHAIEAPPEEYFIFKGTVRNENPFPLEAVLLRIFLDDKLIDQIILRDIKAGAEKEFETSIYNSSKEGEKIYIALYSLSDKKANLIYVKEMSVITKK